MYTHTYIYIYIYTILHSLLFFLAPLAHVQGCADCKCPQGSSTSTCVVQKHPEHCQKTAPLPP